MSRAALSDIFANLFSDLFNGGTWFVTLSLHSVCWYHLMDVTEARTDSWLEKEDPGAPRGPSSRFENHRGGSGGRWVTDLAWAVPRPLVPRTLDVWARVRREALTRARPGAFGHTPPPTPSQAGSVSPSLRSRKMATNFLVHEKIWFDKFKYDDAERRFYERMNGPVAGSSRQVGAALGAPGALAGAVAWGVGRGRSALAALLCSGAVAQLSLSVRVPFFPLKFF